jgi:hypothetical protein
MDYHRTPNSQCFGMTFEEYVNFETIQKNQIAALIYKESKDRDEILYNFKLKLRYNWDCFESLEHRQEELKLLWEELLNIYTNTPIKELQSDLLMLAEMTNESGINNQTKERLDNSLINFSQKKFSEELQANDFDITLEDIVNWYYFRVDYYKVIKIGTTETELHFLQRIVESNPREFERIKFELPFLFISFSHCIKWFYDRLPKIKDKNYNTFFRRIMLGKIYVYKNLGELELMSETIYNYYKSKKGNRSIKWALDYFTGFGEKPFRLIKLYLALHLFFCLIMFLPIFKLKGIEDNYSFFEKAVRIFYFNNTTFLTIGYGDISPDNIPTMLVAIIEQILGFIAAGAFVTLTLRKLFRF